MEPEINIGDIGLETTNSILSDAIRFFMNLYIKRKGYKIKEVYSHGFIFIQVWGQLYVAEAIRTGVTIRPYDVAYPDNKKYKIKVKAPIVQYTNDQQETICKECLKSAMVPHPYDIPDVFAQLIMVLTGKWIGTRGRQDEKRYYCSEFVATMTNRVAPYFPNPEMTNPVDLDLNANFIDKIIYSESRKLN